jgi:hypothetical protein
MIEKILKKWVGWIESGFIWLRTFTSYNMRGNACVADELLVYVEGLCCIELVSFANHCTE